MKTFILTTIFVLFSGFFIKAQTIHNSTLYLGMRAPSCTVQSTKGQINFPGDYYNQWKVLFSHPADFTPVCSSEIIALAERQEDFEKLNTVLLVISTDGLNSHIAWVKSLESIARKDKPPLKINFPLIADVNLKLSEKYNMLRNDSTDRSNIRSVVIIDPDNKIRAFFVYPDNVGRNTDEILRTITALQLADKKSVLIPANWRSGGDVLIQSPKSIEESEKLVAKNNPDLYSWTWYIWFKKLYAFP